MAAARAGNDDKDTADRRIAVRRRAVRENITATERGNAARFGGRTPEIDR